VDRVRRIAITTVTPLVDDGAWPAKAVQGENIPVRACVFTDGHQTLRVRVRWRSLCPGEGPTWRHSPLSARMDDFWTGAMEFSSLGAAEFQVEAWGDVFEGWRSDYRRWQVIEAAPASELLAGVQLVRQSLPRWPEAARSAAAERLESLVTGDPSRLQDYLLSPGVAAKIARALVLTTPTRSRRFPVWVDRPRALFGSWYEMFPRSEGSDGKRSGTLAASEARLPALAEMKFDVVYLPPIQPIGQTGRRGRNNAPVAKPGEPGCPWAIGSAIGGHTAINPELGGLEDFRHFVARAAELGLEVALDYALQCSPDHPWVTQHPDWFRHRPDGSIRTAENPPKRYDDVLPMDFGCADWQGLWNACYDILEFWIGQGVKIFRVDNPHTKPFPFWAWLIARLHASHPEVVFLAEAFTRPALMDELSKLGFSQTYTFFTWRSTKGELRSYLTHLTRVSVDYLRPNFFTNTPDVLTRELQQGGPEAFRRRLVLAATLSPAYGIYSGFELYEHRPQSEGSEDYWDSEKYQYRPRNWGQPGSLAPLATRLNQIRRDHPALQQLRRLCFHRSADPDLLVYSKHTADRSDVVLVAVDLAAGRPRRAKFSLSLKRLGLRPGASFQVHELFQDRRATWRGRDQEIELDAGIVPARIYCVEP
jgi:starch synthase (maltosyl-transferring)